MGMVQCPIHNLTFIQPCCEHIGHAIDAKRYEHANPLVDTFGAPIVLCDPCFHKAVRQTENEMEWFTFHLELGVEIWPYCSDCLKEWYSSTGQGDLSDAIAEIKAKSA
jgi:hypothetical protein